MRSWALLLIVCGSAACVTLRRTSAEASEGVVVELSPPAAELALANVLRARGLAQVDRVESSTATHLKFRTQQRVVYAELSPAGAAARLRIFSTALLARTECSSVAGDGLACNEAASTEVSGETPPSWVGAPRRFSGTSADTGEEARGALLDLRLSAPVRAP